MLEGQQRRTMSPRCPEGMGQREGQIHRAASRRMERLQSKVIHREGGHDCLPSQIFKNMNKKFAAFAIIGAMLASCQEPPSNPEPIRRKKPEKRKPQPGLKEFHFNCRGELVNEKSESIFSCTALNEANARRKLFNSFKK